jgi:hypothetical protein
VPVPGGPCRPAARRPAAQAHQVPARLPVRASARMISEPESPSHGPGCHRTRQWHGPSPPDQILRRPRLQFSASSGFRAWAVATGKERPGLENSLYRGNGPGTGGLYLSRSPGPEHFKLNRRTVTMPVGLPSHLRRLSESASVTVFPGGPPPGTVPVTHSDWQAGNDQLKVNSFERKVLFISGRSSTLRVRRRGLARPPGPRPGRLPTGRAVIMIMSPPGAPQPRARRQDRRTV